MIDDISRRIGFIGLAEWAHEKKEKWIFNYLNNMLTPLIEKYKYSKNVGINQKNSPIWVCWWTGERNASRLVQQCFGSIKNNNSDEHLVHVISKDNYREYLDIPEYILRKMKIGMAHFADYLRVCLTEKYGGFG